ncbi:hypothetical protein CEV34_5675 [Brucella pseudogrignonensis]|uniref:Uncharacterized protein n=1 Tax=Brucella pseudogrignonensis TaxID=419475 RepID=A0A256GCN4_9HYPH|nr:hypothetical protein CEV34_5675 [Brucella pseudogrignonensis]
MKLSNDRAFTLIKNAVPVNYTLAEPFCAKALRDVIRGGNIQTITVFWPITAQKMSPTTLRSLSG